jgi:hypothetical protein
MNRVYVNSLCRQLAADGLLIRRPGAQGKIVNVLVDANLVADAYVASRQPQDGAPKISQRVRGRQFERIESLITGFANWVAAFELTQAFPGPSLYFHQRAIALRRQHQTVDSLLADTQFLEYVYAVLPAWGMHRMGPQAAKVGDFAQITAALRDNSQAFRRLWPDRITALDVQASAEVAAVAWEIIADVKVSTSETQIVAGSKFIHHLLPDLIPPIDRQYTFAFFTGQKMVASDKAAFLDWFPKLADIGARCQEQIRHTISGGGFMATGEAKVIDNAIIGFMQAHRAQREPPSEQE